MADDDARIWATAFAARLTVRQAEHVAAGRDRLAAILGVEIAGLVARMPADAARSPPSVAKSSGTVACSSTDWSAAVFWPEGRFDPSAGTRRHQMLASAAVCRRLGEPGAAVLYERLAERAAPVPAFSPPSIALPFVAGAQLALFG